MKKIAIGSDHGGFELKQKVIGHLEEKHIRKINHALAVSVGLIEEVPENLIMCLCPACANNFYGTGSYYLRRVHPGQRKKDVCTYCGQRPGFDYEVIRRKEVKKEDGKTHHP